MPAILITWPIAKQNPPFLHRWWPKPLPVLISPTHGGIARLSGPQWSENTGMVYPPQVVTNRSTNRARRSLTSLTWPLRQTSHQCVIG